MAVTKLKKPVVRRIGDLVIRLGATGVSVRGSHKQTWHYVSYERVVSLVDFLGDSPILEKIEEENGKKVLRKLTAPTRRRRRA